MVTQTTFNTVNGDEGPDYLTPDGYELYFSRITNGNADLFVSKRGL
jgi:hypothetical protein